MTGVREHSTVVEDMRQIVVCSCSNNDDSRVMFETKRRSVSLMLREGLS